MKITANKYVAVTYDLNVGEGDERELMEKATVERRDCFLRPLPVQMDGSSLCI